MASDIMAVVAKVTGKGQTTVPAKVRKALKVKSGDLLAWEVREGGEAVVRRVTPLDLDYLRAVGVTLSEWASPEDDEAYGEL